MTTWYFDIAFAALVIYAACGGSLPLRGRGEE